MKKILFILAVAVIVSSCTASKDVSSGKQDSKKEKKLAQQAALKQAVESRRYIIKLSKLYTAHGGTAELVPKFNYIIVDGEIAKVSIAYLGGSYGGRPITGINFNGHTIKYEMVSNETKGLFDVNMKVAKGNDTFEFFITIDPSGFCSVSLNNAYLQSVRYRGEITPVTVASNQPEVKQEKF